MLVVVKVQRTRGNYGKVDITDIIEFHKEDYNWAPLSAVVHWSRSLITRIESDDTSWNGIDYMHYLVNTDLYKSQVDTLDSIANRKMVQEAMVFARDENINQLI